MCGIIGYAGVEPAAPVLLNALERLEYRGYDSAGLAIVGAQGIERLRAQGRLRNLRGKAESGAPEGVVGIGHTRWATHGAPTEQNAHPHVGAKGLYTIVHNGIIENYAALRDDLRAQGIACATDTDTEVIAQLLDLYDAGSPLETLRKVLPLLAGSYALAILYRGEPDSVYAARLRSPLLACLCPSGALLASDAAALLPHSREIYRMADGELARLRRAEIQFFDASLNAVEKQPVAIDRHVTAADKEGWAHFMRKEMAEQPETVRLTLEPLLKRGGVDLGEADLKNPGEIDRVLFLGCGSAWHVGVAGRLVIEELTGIPASAELASEFRSAPITVNRNTLVIVISQSGETADTLMALRRANEAGARTLGIINVVGSSIAQESGSVLYTKAGLEVAVATTKAYSTQLAAVYAVAARLAQLRGSVSEGALQEFLHALAALPDQMEETLQSSESPALAWAQAVHKQEHAYYLGRQLDYAAALEGSLKLKEISYIHAEAYAAGELKHGTISLIEPGTPVICACCREDVLAKALSNMEEVRARGADVFAVTSDPQLRAAHVLRIPKTHPLLGVSLAVLPLQLFAYHCARLRGCDIDKPRSLAKSVTVE
ncbi:MAG: glutamine--fructose-6-phosphate transaminase (isomerizing) [Oscillospiraceae bacterium]|jgi:glucosamine--fructose-6-phosphate aminotransferase (isomerizing)|nr:glutamine--fructose-6-phosphate transaminase (isomerizing) [Oscillospiraceae bacterium]